MTIDNQIYSITRLFDNKKGRLYNNKKTTIT